MNLFRIFIVFYCAFCFGQKKVETPLNDLFKEVVFTLADDSLKGRAIGSIEEKISLNYIASKLNSESQELRLEQQPFEVYWNNTTFILNNGYVFVDNHSDKTILLSAHYDHIGFGGTLSTKFITNQIHNGADDNASGVAMTIGLARELSKVKTAPVNYLFAFYTAHEIGLFGSAKFGDFVSKHANYFKKIVGVFNFDMIGRFDPSIKILKCMRSKEVDIIFDRIPIDDFNLKLNVGKEEQLMKLDTRFFYNQGVPCVNFTTGIHLDYHAPSDDAIYVNFDGMVQITNYIIQTISCYNDFLTNK